MEIEGLNLTDEEKEILKRKVSLKMESINAVVQDIQIMEYIGKHKKLDSDAEFGIVPITEFISSHPEFFKRTDIDLVQRENNLDGVYVAQFVGGYILMNEGHVIGNARELSGEDGKKSLDFSFSKSYIENQRSIIKDLELLGLDSKYIERYNELFGANGENRLNTLEKVVTHIADGNLLDTIEKKVDALGIEGEDREALYRLFDERGNNRVREKSDEVQEEKNDKEEIEKIDRISDVDERASKMAVYVRKKFMLPVRIEAKLVSYFKSHPNERIENLEQVVNVKESGLEVINRRLVDTEFNRNDGEVLIFLSHDNAKKNVTFIQDGGKYVDATNTKGVDNTVELMERIYKSPVIDNLDRSNDAKKRSISYVDIDDHWTVEELTEPRNMSDDVIQMYINKFEDCRKKEKAILASLKVGEIKPDQAMTQLEDLHLDRLRILDEAGFNVGAIRSEILADISITNEIQGHISDKEAEKDEESNSGKNRDEDEYEHLPGEHQR